MIAIKTVDLVKRYKDLTAVNKLNLEIRKGELFSLLGVNGAGKTTVIKMLTCLTAPTEGEAFVGNYRIGENQDGIKRIIGVSPQETAVAPNLSVKENLQLICGIHGFSKEKTIEKIQMLTDRFSLSSVIKRKAGKLSGGWQRRVSIAMALIGEPEILFLDEPTLGLDVIARRELWEVIRSLRKKATVVLTTHYMEEAKALSDRIGIFSLTALAFIAGGMNAIYKIERLALSVAILIHGAVLYIAYLATYLINGWLKSGSLPILVFSVIFILGYLAVWAVIYFTTKKKTEKLNAMLKKKQDSIADQTK